MKKKWSITKDYLDLLLTLQGVVRLGDGVIDWFLPPYVDHPSGRFRITRIKQLEDYPGQMIFYEYVGPVPDIIG